jgi:hypothetical protein
MKVNEARTTSPTRTILAVYKGKIVHLCCSDCVRSS